MLIPSNLFANEDVRLAIVLLRARGARCCFSAVTEVNYHTVSTTFHHLTGNSKAQGGLPFGRINQLPRNATTKQAVKPMKTVCGNVFTVLE
jgi:hypothetical protein